MTGSQDQTSATTGVPFMFADAAELEMVIRTLKRESAFVAERAGALREGTTDQRRHRNKADRIDALVERLIDSKRAVSS